MLLSYDSFASVCTSPLSKLKFGRTAILRPLCRCAPLATRLAADVEPIPGYRLIDRLGRGGFGEVWKCEAPGGMLKAIKFVYGNLDEATENGKPAEQELKALNRVKSIRHPYILSLERYDIIEGQLVIVMEL